MPQAPVDSVVRAGALRPFPYTLLDTVSFELDGDPEPERIELLATVERNQRGELLWEDGHNWGVVVRDGSTSYPLVERFVPWGRAELLALREEPTGRPVVVVVTRSDLGCSDSEGNVGVTLEKFAYAPQHVGYVREAVAESSGAGVCTKL